MKDKKASGIDGIPMEAWKYAGQGVRKELEELIKQIWKVGRIPEEWRISIVIPIHKRGDKEKAGNYRGISLLCTAYKIYPEILRKRLEREVEEKGILPESQAGFKKGRATVDNVFILDHLVQREKRKEKKNKKIYTLFVDLKTAFDNINREIVENHGKAGNINGNERKDQKNLRFNICNG